MHVFLFSIIERPCKTPPECQHISRISSQSTQIMARLVAAQGSAETRREVVKIRAFRTRAPRSFLDERSASPTSPLPDPLDQTHHERKDSSHIILHLRNQESYRRGKTAIPPPIRARVMTIRWSGGTIRLLFAGSERGIFAITRFAGLPDCGNFSISK